MKKTKLFAVLLVLLLGSTLSAKSFDWSECWCNYGAGVEEGDFIINVDTGLYYTDMVYRQYDNFWFVPPVVVDVQYAKKIWKLPFTFGGYAGIHGYGFEYDHWDNVDYRWEKRATSSWGLFVGAEAAYHVKMPVEILDLYVASKMGFNIPFSKPDAYWVSDYFHFDEAIGANFFFTKNVGLNVEIG